MSRTGAADLVDPSLRGEDYITLALSPADDRLAVTITSGDGESAGVPQLWVKELPDGPMTRLTRDSLAARRPVWSRDGRFVSYIAQGPPSSGVAEARRMAADGSSQGAAELLLRYEAPVYEIFFTPDERGLIFRHGDAGQDAADLALVALPAEDGEPDALLASSFNEFGASLSPDGRWLAYASNASGRNEIFVRPFPEVRGAQVQVSTTGGVSPAWAHNGRELFFVDGESWMIAAEYAAEGTFTVVGRERLFSLEGYFGDGQWRGFDVDSSDERLLLIRTATADDPRPGVSGEAQGLVLVRGYFQELRARVAR